MNSLKHNASGKCIKTNKITLHRVHTSATVSLPAKLSKVKYTSICIAHSRNYL